MSDTKFTKGEWEVSSCGLAVNVNGHKVARAHSGSAIPYTLQSKANANLIKASPKMYKILESIYESARYAGTYSSEMDEIKAVLVEARGES